MLLFPAAPNRNVMRWGLGTERNQPFDASQSYHYDLSLANAICHTQQNFELIVIVPARGLIDEYGTAITSPNSSGEPRLLAFPLWCDDLNGKKKSQHVG